MRIVTQYLTVRTVTATVLALIAAATVWGLVALWPDPAQVAKIADRMPLTAEGTSFESGEVLSIADDCGDGSPGACHLLTVGITSGDDAGRIVDVPLRGALTQTGLQPGDDVELFAIPAQTPPPAADAEQPQDPSTEPGASAPTETQAETRYQLAHSYSLSGVFRGLPLALLTFVFAAVVISVGRMRGLLALGALVISAGVLLGFLLPALVTGSPGLLTGVIAASAIMFVILYLVHGFNMRTTSALIGTLCGIAIMAGVSLISMHATRLSGIGDEASGTLSAFASDIDFRGLLSCSIIIAGLGILNDVTITQASSAWELRAAAPSMPRSELYAATMRIGRDHIASTVYTVFFAYVGAALGVLILLYLYDRPLLSLLTHEDIAIEIVRTLCGSIGLILAVPITSWVATMFAPAPDSPEAQKLAAAPDLAHGHSHGPFRGDTHDGPFIFLRRGK